MWERKLIVNFGADHQLISSKVQILVLKITLLYTDLKTTITLVAHVQNHKDLIYQILKNFLIDYPYFQYDTKLDSCLNMCYINSKFKKFNAWN